MSRHAPTGTVTATRIAEVVGRLRTRPAYAGARDGPAAGHWRRAAPRRRAPPQRARPRRAARPLADHGDSRLRDAARGGVRRRAPGRGDVHPHPRRTGPHLGPRSRPGSATTRPLTSTAPRPRRCPGSPAPTRRPWADLPAYPSGHGYYPAGLPELQQRLAEGYRRRGLPTDPEQVFVTVGALTAATIAARAPALDPVTGCWWRCPAIPMPRRPSRAQAPGSSRSR